MSDMALVTEPGGRKGLRVWFAASRLRRVPPLPGTAIVSLLNANPCTVTNVTTSVTTLSLAEGGLIEVGRLGRIRFQNLPSAANCRWIRALRCSFQGGMCIQ
jgi:hypothetical protein